MRFVNEFHFRQISFFSNDRKQVELRTCFLIVLRETKSAPKCLERKFSKLNNFDTYDSTILHALFIKVQTSTHHTYFRLGNSIWTKTNIKASEYVFTNINQIWKSFCAGLKPYEYVISFISLNEHLGS